MEEFKELLNQHRENNNQSLDEKESEILNPKSQTSAKAIALANFVKDPKLKIEIFSKDRNIPEENYFFSEKGELLFKGEDNKIYREHSEGFWPKARKFGVETAVDPITYLPIGGVGIAAKLGAKAIGKFGASMAGGSLASAARQAIGKITSDEKMSFKERAIDVGVETTIGGVSELGMMGAGKVLKTVSSPMLGSVSKKVSNFLKKQGLLDKKIIENIYKTQEEAKKFGINLNIMEASDNASIERWMAPILKTEEGHKIVDLYKKRPEEIKKSIPSFLKTLYPFWVEAAKKEPLAAKPGWTIRRSVNKQLEDLTLKRKELVRPFYEVAYKQNPIIETKFVAEYIEDLADRSIKSKSTKLLSLVDDLKNNEGNFEISLEKLDSFKKFLDDKIYRSTKDSSADIEINRELKKIKNMLVEKMDEKYPLYRQARAAHALAIEGKGGLEQALRSDLSKDNIQKLLKEGETSKRIRENIEHIANISDKDLETISGYFLSSSKSSPEIVRTTRNAVLKQNGGEKIWKNAIADFIEYKSMNIVETNNFAKDFYKSLYGTEKSRLILKNALSPSEYKNLSLYLNIIARAGKFNVKNVENIPKTELTRSFHVGAVRIFKKMVNAATIYSDNLQQLITEKGAKELVSLVLDPNATKKLEKISKINDINEQFEQLLRFTGWQIARETSN